MYKFSSATGGAAASLHQAAMSRSSLQRAPAPWLMPWETGDRATGEQEALWGRACVQKIDVWGQGCEARGVFGGGAIGGKQGDSCCKVHPLVCWHAH